MLVVGTKIDTEYSLIACPWRVDPNDLATGSEKCETRSRLRSPDNATAWKGHAC